MTMRKRFPYQRRRLVCLRWQKCSQVGVILNAITHVKCEAKLTHLSLNV